MLKHLIIIIIVLRFEDQIIIEKYVNIKHITFFYFMSTLSNKEPVPQDSLVTVEALNNNNNNVNNKNKNKIAVGAKQDHIRCTKYDSDWKMSCY